MARTGLVLGWFLVSCAVTGCLASLENSLVYRPQPGQQPPEVPPPPIEDLELYSGLAKIPTAETKIHARWAPHPRGQGAILYCHGNGGNVDLWGRAVRELWQNLEESVLIFDYPGYGYSGGTPSEEGCYAAAEAAYHWLTVDKKVPPERIILYGESLGGGVAVELASRQPHRSLVLVRTFTSFPDVVDDQFPLIFSSGIVTNRFDNLAKIGACKRPIFIAHGDKDRTIPLRHGQRLYQAVSPDVPAELCVLKNLGHNDPLPRDYYVTLRQFLAKTALQ